MAQAGYTPISLYYSTTASTAPTSGNLVSGELAINITDGKLYYKDNGGTVQIIASKAGASGDVVGPASATDNAIVRFDGATGKLVQNSVVTIADSTGDISGVGQLNATTLDATNIEVTNIKAKDGTAAASIADSTGVVSITANPILSGGTANGVLYLDGSKVATSGSGLVFDSSGNLGLGVTPSGWATLKGFDISSGGGLFGHTAQVGIANNAYYDGSSWRYKNTDAAAFFRANALGFEWHTAPSGTAGNAITFSQVMTLDASGNLGIGTSSPSGFLGNKLVVATGGTANEGITIYSSSNNGSLWFADATTGTGRYAGGIDYQHSTDTLIFYSNTLGNMRLDSSGNLKLGGTAERATTVGTNHLDIFNGTAPVGTLTNGISLYSSSGEAYVMDAAGNSTLLSPHDSKTNEWIFHSKHTPTGKVLRIDVERLLKFVNDHFGLDAVQEFIEP